MTDYLEASKMLAVGLTAGVLSGLFGVGGGLVIVPALIVLFGFPPPTATGTSLFVILFPTGLLGVLEYWNKGNIRPIAGLWIALGLFLGAFVGARFAQRLPATTMQRFYAVFMLGVAVYFLLVPPRSPTGRAQIEARPVPPDAVASPPGSHDVH